MEERVSNFAEKTGFILALIIYISTIVSLAYLSDANIFIVFIGTLPTLLYLITFFFLIKNDFKKSVLWVLPLLYPMIFLILWYLETFKLLNTLDGQVLTVLNILISYLVNIFVLFVFSIGIKRTNQKVDNSHYEHKIGQMNKELDSIKSQLESTTNELESTQTKLIDAKKEVIINKDNFNITLRSIEDKCKAINFVIGRVYSDKKGANENIREKLRITSNLYNSFSELTNDFKLEDKTQMEDILKQILKKLIVLELPENKVMSLDKAKLPVIRNEEGNDTIIEVLRKNDKDPITDYHKEAKEICIKLMKFLNESK
jgi:hypothetical protein